MTWKAISLSLFPVQKEVPSMQNRIPQKQWEIRNHTVWTQHSRYQSCNTEQLRHAKYKSSTSSRQARSIFIMSVHSFRFFSEEFFPPLSKLTPLLRAVSIRLNRLICSGNNQSFSLGIIVLFSLYSTVFFAVDNLKFLSKLHQFNMYSSLRPLIFLAVYLFFWCKMWLNLDWKKISTTRMICLLKII